MSTHQAGKQEALAATMKAAPVIPVVSVNDPEEAVAMARALVKGGLPAIEVTLRTEKAIECLEAIAGEVEGCIPGAGTVLSAGQIEKCDNAGAKFLVSPGAAPLLLEAAEDSSVPLLPGTATASEIMRLGERGYRHLKFFPAEQAGGASYLKAISAPLPQFRFCPTGGVKAETAGDYLALPNVLCVGGSWVATNAMIEAQDWAGIEALARKAAAIAGA